MRPNINPMVESVSEALSIYINQLVYDKKSKGERVYTYSLGEAFFDIPRFEISDEEMKEGYHYSSSKGQPQLRKKISEMYMKRYQVTADPECEILVSAGSKALIFMALQTCVCPGDEVVYHEPAWLSYKEQIKLAGGRSVAIPYFENIYKWKNYISDKTKVLIVNNPNNPSGKLYSREEITFLLKLAREKNFFIIADEAYSDFLIPGDEFISFARLDREKENVIVVNSLSKNMGMSGWRVGYVIAHKMIIQQILKLNQHFITCAASVLQSYMSKYFFNILECTIPQAVEIAYKRNAVKKIMDRVGIKALEGVGTFYFLVDVSDFQGETEELAYDLLLNYNIATVPGGAYGDSTKDFLRFGIGVENLEDIERSLTVIKEVLNLKKYDPSKIRDQMKKLL